MTQPKGRADNGPTLRHILAAVVLVQVAALAACATPATEQGSGTPPAPAALSEPPPGASTARCAVNAAVPVPGHPARQPSPVDEAAERRAAEVLQKMAEEAAPQERGTLPAAARSGATACAHEISRTLSLYAGLDGRVPDAAKMREFLESTGLERITVRSRGRYDAGTPEGLVFSGWTGQACVYGGFVSEGPDIRIGQPFADGACLPPG